VIFVQLTGGGIDLCRGQDGWAQFTVGYSAEGEQAVFVVVYHLAADLGCELVHDVVFDEWVVDGVAAIGPAKYLVTIIHIELAEPDGNTFHDIVDEAAVHEEQLVELDIAAFYPGVFVVPGGQIGDKAYPDTICQLDVDVQIGHGEVESWHQVFETVHVSVVTGHRGGRSRILVVQVLKGLFEIAAYLDVQLPEEAGIVLGRLEDIETCLIIRAIVLHMPILCRRCEAQGQQADRDEAPDSVA